MRAFYFATENRKLRYNDNRPIVVGETHSVEGEIKVCENGLHASERIIDALQYAPGPILYLVELSGTMDKSDNKIAAQYRTYLKEFDATEVLQKFARMQAKINIEKIKPYCSNEDYELILSWLNTGNEDIQSAAWSAAESAARSAARSVAWSAAWSAAESAAESAVESAAWSAAESAAWSAAESVAESVANKMLLTLVEEAMDKNNSK